MPLVKKLQPNTKYLDNLQDAIGKWQDILLEKNILKIHPEKKLINSFDIKYWKQLNIINDLARDFDKKASFNCFKI